MSAEEEHVAFISEHASPLVPYWEALKSRRSERVRGSGEPSVWAGSDAGSTSSRVATARSTCLWSTWSRA